MHACLCIILVTQTVCAHFIAVNVGQFYSPKVRLNMAKKELTRADGEKIPVQEGPLWDTIKDGRYADRECWYPEEGYSAIEGEPWQYVVEHLLATTFKRTLYS